MWVVAAAEGRIALYEKLAHGGADLIPIGQSITPQSLEALAQFLRQAYAQKQYEQLLIIGSPNDVCWVQSLLPEEVAGCVVAEIRYTLLPSWFQHTPHMPELTHALNNVLVAR